jgi:phospholipid/cholesterol/gamma-HCH transport system permease protein
MLLQLVQGIGAYTIALVNTVGEVTVFLIHVVFTFVTTKLKLHKLFEQMKAIGVDSLSIVLLTGISTGGVLALQTYSGFKRFGGEEFLGPVVALSMIRELGPVLTGLMVAGRVGSSIAAELGTMQITEQIDALKTLCINVFQFLMVPRVLGAAIILPFLTVFSMMCGIGGGYCVYVYVLHLNGEQYISGIRTFVEMSDITGGLIKAAVFGLILSWIGCYKGFTTRGGAKGVGSATTESVVTSSIMILIANYFLTALLF